MSPTSLDADEPVVRIIFRLPAEISLPIAAADFVRRNKVRPLNKAESGISLLRPKMLKTFDAIYQYVGAYKKAMGAAQSTLSNLTDLGFKYVVSDMKPEHISLRCADCNMQSNICLPNNQTNCPLFNNTETQVKLAKQFILVSPPKLRMGGKK
jgi:hypothetical protein